MNRLLGAAVVALVLMLAFAAAVHTGLIVVAPWGAGGGTTANLQSGSQPQPQTQPRTSVAAAAAPAAAQAPQPNVLDQKTYGDWIYTCVERANGEGIRCSIMQHLSEAKTKTMVLSWRITRTRDGSLAGVWHTPDLVMLQAGIALDVGAPKPFVIPYETCGNGRCQARVKLPDDFIDSLAKAQKAVVSIVGANGQRANLNMSVKGLADGLAALQPANQPATAAPQPR